MGTINCIAMPEQPIFWFNCSRFNDQQSAVECLLQRIAHPKCNSLPAEAVRRLSHLVIRKYLVSSRDETSSALLKDRGEFLFRD